MNPILTNLNNTYLRLHTRYENFFWRSYMGDHSIDSAMEQAKKKLDAFKTSPSPHLLKKLAKLATSGSSAEKNSCQTWSTYFTQQQTPAQIKVVKEQAMELETKIHQRMATAQTGYTDPQTQTFIPATNAQMRMKMSTENDERVRKACFDGIQATAGQFLTEYVEIIKLRNTYAQGLGYTDFYAYKAQTQERMESNDIFALFDTLTTQLKPALARIRDLEQTIPGLRKPRNRSYHLAGDFIKREDPYFPLQTCLDTRGRSFAACGIDYQGATMKLDLLERQGKYNNGFCHMPVPVHYVQEKIEGQRGKTCSGRNDVVQVKNPGMIGFTCTAIPGQVGSGRSTLETLFHEGGHAAHFANMAQQDIILNTEYEPMSTARAETQSMFLDTMCSSIEWKMRYARDLAGNPYPFALYEEKIRKLHKIAGDGLLSIAAVVKFEQIAYTTDPAKLTPAFLQDLANTIATDYFDYTEPTARILTVPHIYSRESSAYYHGYGMAELALTQWRKYFYETDGYIVDNPRVGQEMTKVWQRGSAKSMQELLIMATGKKLSPDAFLEHILLTEDQVIERAKKRLTKMASVPVFQGKPQLNAHISIYDGKGGRRCITSNDAGRDELCQRWAAFVTKRIGK